MSKKLEYKIRELKYTQSRIIYTKRNSEEYRIEFLNNLKETFNDFDFRTKVEGTSIEFERLFRNIATTGTKRDTFKNLRTGRINISIQSSNLIKIKSVLDLSRLTYLTIFMGIFLILFGWFWDSNLIGTGILSIFTMLVVFIIGWIRVTGKIDRIIDKSMEKT